MASRQLIRRVTAYTGLHVLLQLLPLRWQAQLAAREMLDVGGPWHGIPIDGEVPLIVVIFGSAWRVIDAQGNVVPARDPAAAVSTH